MSIQTDGEELRIGAAPKIQNGEWWENKAQASASHRGGGRSTAGAQSRQERTTETVGRVQQLRSWEVGIPLEFKQGMGPDLQMRWESRCSSQLVAGTSAFISSYDRDPGLP